ncbi:MAG: 2-succinyl-5-enolpyruvyl-6-hydroxy-3-cyclohexene-1-carboxylic-acid synthase [SAR324 cluster bacterium]|nr:2-succinyl-5-enolpyruvyl-6-hydroxy-3-cyclohexene-1-carboxylic-acid synthase [SAR324 cluster bacterium]MBL7034465.1 2-succinyl-5-enolpyruvyl-6-hydroxy-3-cyclohexene-1-carboxylic-acid synthase [SAR324 cluster bacterium]
MNWNERWGEWIIEELVRLGTECFCISPGSRSTPLTTAVARNPGANSVVFYDERAAAYYALGHARATGRPAVLICTSGTAAANYLPAVIESSVEHIPLLVLTADRPAELQDTGANQAINQTNLFGSFVRWFFDPGSPCPEFSLNSLLSVIDHAVSKTNRPVPGPVQLNLPFREPFFENAENNEKNEKKLLPEKNSYIRFAACRKILPVTDINNLLKNCPSSGILSIGRVPAGSLPSIRKLAEALGWPVFADVTSGLRLGNNCPNRITYYDQLLHKDPAVTNIEPHAVWHIGFPPTSKRWLSYWAQKPAQQMVWIADHAERLDQSHNFRWIIEADITEFCDQVAANLKQKTRNPLIQSNTEQWRLASEQVEKLLEQHFNENLESKEINEFGLVRKLTETVPKTHSFFIGNSLPVRAVDMVGSGKGADIPTALNRGASGIDGLIATACGYCSGLKRPLTLLLGDLSALHDLNSFKILADSQEQILLILLNNHGGGIFSFLPVVQQTDIFEPFFGTPHNYDFRSVSAMFNLNYYKPDSIADFEKDYQQALSSNKSAVLEIISEREQNPQQLEILRQKIMKSAFESS